MKLNMFYIFIVAAFAPLSYSQNPTAKPTTRPTPKPTPKPTYKLPYNPSDGEIVANRAYASVIGTLAFILWIYLLYDKEKYNVKLFLQKKYLKTLAEDTQLLHTIYKQDDDSKQSIG